MRMWMVNPKWMCRQHLLGEHNEIHKHLPSLRRGVNISGRFKPIVQAQLWSIQTRHDELADEIVARGWNHRSPLVDVPDLLRIYPHYFYLSVDLVYNIRDLESRCPACRRLIALGRSQSRKEK